MHFSYVEIGDNFVPDIVADQFRRKPVKFGITLNPGDSMDDAIKNIEQAIKEYIEKNTVYHSPDFISESLPPEPAVLPSIQKEVESFDKPLSEQIAECKTLEDLVSYKVLAYTHGLKHVYHVKFNSLKQTPSETTYQ